MPNTTPTVSSLESIDLVLLTDVSGGCGKKCCSCPPPAPPAPELVAMPQIAAAPLVSTSVSINGQTAQA